MAAISEAQSSTVSLVAIMEARSAKVMRDIARMFNNTKYSDAMVVIHGKNLPVHKSVICTQSENFEKTFKENTIEGSSGVANYDDESGAAYWRMFEYLYTGDYSDDLSHDFEDDSALLKEPRVYALADRFLLGDLKALATAKLQKKLEELWTSQEFPDCIRQVYATTVESDRAMRSAVVEVAKEHVRELGTKVEFKDLIREGGDFAVEYFESVVFPAPPTVSSTRTQAGSGFGAFGSYSTGSRAPTAWG
ncbi:hypothetical protein DE146DRAFT_278733 [Phaeosphaeria sp. MPI-PUGE-AT-0046c]|nr:hypothetical protein DE146DRAFT_278733 [Phaeosphaeria sp. MPI-PUGE-AT-0046c]